MMRFLVSGSVAMLLLGCGSATAQPYDRGFARGMAGFAFGSEPAFTYGAGVGIPVRSDVSVMIEFGSIRNVVPDAERDVEFADFAENAGTGALHASIEQADRYARLISPNGSPRFEARVRVPAAYLAAGTRVEMLPARATHPYVEGSGGIACLTPHLDLRNLDGSDSGLAGDAFESGIESATEFMVLGGAGLAINIGFQGSGLDIGYRFTHIFSHDPQPNTSIVYGALRIGF